MDRADFRFAPSQRGTVLLCDDVSHWLGLESALYVHMMLSLAITTLGPRKKMADIFADDIFKCIFLNNNFD